MKYDPYSFSKINTFKQCQKKFEWTYVNKKEIDDNYTEPTFFQRGSFIHKYIANRLIGGNGEIRGYTNIDVDEKLKLIEKTEESLKNEYINFTFDFEDIEIEKLIRFDENLIANDIPNNYSILGFIDYYAVQDDFAVIIDWKSGQYRENPSFDQLKFYSIWIFQKYPKVEKIDLIFFYIEHQKFKLKTVYLDEIIAFRKQIFQDILEIEKTAEFKINPSKNCVYCPFFETCYSEYNIKI